MARLNGSECSLLKLPATTLSQKMFSISARSFPLSCFPHQTAGLTVNKLPGFTFHLIPCEFFNLASVASAIAAITLLSRWINLSLKVFANLCRDESGWCNFSFSSANFFYYSTHNRFSWKCLEIDGSPKSCKIESIKMKPIGYCIKKTI